MSVQHSRFSSSFLVFLALVAASVASLACDPGHDITYVNEIDEPVTVLVDGAIETTLQPLETKEVLSFEFQGEATFEAKDERGQVVYTDTLTWDELKEAGWRIVITQSAQPGDS